MTGECAYCGRVRALTEEHAIPQWLESLCDAQGEYQRVIDGELVPSGYKRATRSVCVECHRWINHTYEEPVQPIITPLVLGEVAVISPSEQTVIAGWANKVALGQAIIDYEARRVRELCRDFKLSGVPSSRTVVALGAVPPVLNPRAVKWPNHPVVDEQPPDEAPDVPPSSIRQTVQALHVVMLVEHLPRNSLAKQVSDAHRLDPRLTLIWPLTGVDVTWPPPILFEEPLQIAFMSMRRR